MWNPRSVRGERKIGKSFHSCRTESDWHDSSYFERWCVNHWLWLIIFIISNLTKASSISPRFQARRILILASDRLTRLTLTRRETPSRNWLICGIDRRGNIFHVLCRKDQKWNESSYLCYTYTYTYKNIQNDKSYRLGTTRRLSPRGGLPCRLLSNQG